MGSVKSQVLLFLDFFNRSKTRGGVSDKNFCDETKILSGIWIGSRTGDYNCIDNYKYYYSIIEKRKSKKIRENERKNVNK